MDRYKADILSSTRKLRFKYQGYTIEVNVINTKDQTVLDKSNLNMLWDRMKVANEKIFFQGNEKMNVYLYLA